MLWLLAMMCDNQQQPIAMTSNCSGSRQLANEKRHKPRVARLNINSWDRGTVQSHGFRHQCDDPPMLPSWQRKNLTANVLDTSNDGMVLQSKTTQLCWNMLGNRTVFGDIQKILTGNTLNRKRPWPIIARKKLTTNYATNSSLYNSRRS